MDIALHLVVFAAALFQAATGIGFGLIAGPVLLLLMSSAGAIQISAILSFAIAVMLVPALLGAVDRRALAWLMAGCVAGIPAGALAFVLVDVAALKLLAGATVLAMTVLMRVGVGAGAPVERTPRGGALAAGVLSGLMTATLAMPGPAPAAWMARHAAPRDAVRATILSLFLVAYPAAIAFQALFGGIAAATLVEAAWLLPATAAGVLAGSGLARRINQAAFVQLISAILLATGVALIGDVLVW